MLHAACWPSSSVRPTLRWSHMFSFVVPTGYPVRVHLRLGEVRSTGYTAVFQAVYVGMLGLAKGRARRPMICSNVQVDSEYSCSLYVHILVL